MSNLIKHSDAIEALGEEPEVWDDADEFANGMRMQWNCDRKAIEAVPSARTQMSSADCINRQDAIDAKAEFLNPNVKRETEEQTTIDRAYAKGWNDCNSHWIDGIENLPSAERKGKWILHQDSRTWECSECHKYQVIHSDYCMHCGASMVRGEEKGEEEI